MEAESFVVSSPGWQAVSDDSTRQASAMSTLHGASGPVDAIASKSIAIKSAGRYRIWVRYSMSHRQRGPFRLAVTQANDELGADVFDAADDEKKGEGTFVWSSFDADLPAGDLKLELSKHEKKNCSAATRHVDCVLVTSDLTLTPNHLLYGPQTYLRVTMGEGYDRPVYLHVFADHFHFPWYQHFSLGRGGAAPTLAPGKADLLKSGEATPWCNITPMLYQDSGAMLNLSVRHTYVDRAERLKAKLEFATAPDEKAIVRTIDADCQPNGMVINVPPNLTVPEYLEHFKTDRDIAEETGKLADAHAWPAYGHKPEKIPFFVSARLSDESSPFDAAVSARENKTLAYFGFTPREGRAIGGLWLMKNRSYCQPDLEAMKTRAAAAAKAFKNEGHSVKDIVFCEVMDEPTGQPLSFVTQDAAYAEQFRAWLRKLGLTPQELLVADWEAVRPVTEAQRNQFPALYYFSQRFRTRALGDFIALQGEILKEAYGGDFPVLANFSDGVVYQANFYSQGVDYFELLSSPDQNAIWGEDWSNLSSTYQCAAFNVDLMRAAARDHGQIIGQHLIAHAGRKGWDIKLKAASESARGVKIWNNFFYGPSWGTHEGGPYWKSHAWYSKPDTWTANAEATREVGGAEDMLLHAMPAPAKVAILYSSSSDAWSVRDDETRGGTQVSADTAPGDWDVSGNLAYGFDRMHTWLALTHAQTPVNIVSEQQAANGALDHYAVCYLTGPHLTRAASAKLKEWVRQGGTLWLTAGAASRDEYNRPVETLDELLPATREVPRELQRFESSGRYLKTLVAKDEVTWDGGSAEVLSVKQALKPHAGAQVLATFKDGSPALVTGAAGRGTIYCAGFLPSLAYIKSALVARVEVETRIAASQPVDEADRARVLQSSNPWQYPAPIRDLLLTPVRSAHVATPITCDVPLVDAVFMPCDQGVLIPLANYTLNPIPKVTLKVAVTKPIARIESVRHGALAFQQSDESSVVISLPLDASDFVKLYYR